MARYADGKDFLSDATVTFTEKCYSVYGGFAVYAGKTPCSTAVYTGRLKEEMNNHISNQHATNATHSSVYGVQAAYTSFLTSTSR